MKKKVLSTVLSMSLAFTCIPALALATLSSTIPSESAWGETEQGKEAAVINLADPYEISLEDYGTFEYHKAVGDIDDNTPELADAMLQDNFIRGTYIITKDFLRDSGGESNAYKLNGDATLVFLKSDKNALSGPTLTCYGREANNFWHDGGAAINTNGRKLTVKGVGTLNAYGGKAAAGEDGRDASSEGMFLERDGKLSGTQGKTTDGGRGGDGGNGGGAGIGTDGGRCGLGGFGGKAVYGDDYMNAKGWESANNGWYHRNGTNGGDGWRADYFLDRDGLIVKGNVTINAKGGQESPSPAASAGAKAGEDKDGMQLILESGWPTYNYVTVASGAGGGGGGHGAAGADIGSGGAGGGGGGGGAGGGCGSGDMSSAYILGTAGGGSGGSGTVGGKAAESQKSKFGGDSPDVAGKDGDSDPYGPDPRPYWPSFPNGWFQSNYISTGNDGEEPWIYFAFSGGFGGRQGEVAYAYGKVYATTLSGASANKNEAARYQAFPITECKFKVVPKNGSVILNQNDVDGSFTVDGSVFHRTSELGAVLTSGPVFAFNGQTPEFDVVVVHAPTGEIVSSEGYSHSAFDASVGAAATDSDALSIVVGGGEASTDHSYILWKDGEAHAENLFTLKASIKYDAELAECQDPVRNWVVGSTNLGESGTHGEAGSTLQACGIQKAEGMVTIYNPMTDSYVNVPTSDFEIEIVSIDPDNVGPADAGRKKVYIKLTAEQADHWYGLTTNGPCTLGSFKTTIKAG